MLIYHYTSQQAALKILELQSLWLTNVGQLNDNLEHKWYFKRALELNVQIPIPWVDSEFKRREKHKDDLINLGYMTADDSYPDEASIFVASFSSVADDLSQWNQYADKGMGVSLGFDAVLVKTWASAIKGLKTRADFVNYDGEHTDRAIKASTKYSGLDGVFHKTNSWASEKEFRIACGGVSYENYQFRAAGATLVSYIPLEFPNIWGAIKEVWLGPLVSPHSFFSWSTLLSKHRQGNYHDKISLLKSGVSLRIN